MSTTKIDRSPEAQSARDEKRYPYVIQFDARIGGREYTFTATRYTLPTELSQAVEMDVEGGPELSNRDQARIESEACDAFTEADLTRDDGILRHKLAEYNGIVDAENAARRMTATEWDSIPVVDVEFENEDADEATQDRLEKQAEERAAEYADHLEEMRTGRPAKRHKTADEIDRDAALAEDAEDARREMRAERDAAKDYDARYYLSGR